MSSLYFNGFILTDIVTGNRWTQWTLGVKINVGAGLMLLSAMNTSFINESLWSKQREYNFQNWFGNIPLQNQYLSFKIIFSPLDINVV
jgi:hypothetical protein